MASYSNQLHKQLPQCPAHFQGYSYGEGVNTVCCKHQGQTTTIVL